MESWLKISILLCTFGFLKEFRPSEPFIFKFLVGPWRNITAEEINQKVFPVNVFSYLAQLVIIFLITDLSRYKPLIILLGLCGIIIWSMLLWTKTLLELQILEGIYGTYMATEVAYYTYIYAKVPRENYQQVTGHVRAAILTGKCLSAVTSQLLVSFNVMDLRELNYISFSTQILATLWAFSLPSVSKSIYFYQDETTSQESNNNIKRAFNLLWDHFYSSYSQSHVLKWSLWWAMATCISIQIQNYMQPLWFQIQQDDSDIYNGAVEAVSMLLGTVGALIAGNMKLNWTFNRELILTICSVIIGAVLLVTSQTEYIFISYSCYIIFNVLYQFIVTVASSEVAQKITDDSFGLVFGINLLIALILQTILTIIVVDGDIGLGMTPRNQYVVYGCYFFVIAIIYFIMGILNWFKSR